MQNIEKIIDQVNGSMTIEGMPLTDEDKIRIRHCVGNKTKVDETIANLVKKHSMYSIHDEQ